MFAPGLLGPLPGLEQLRRRALPHLERLFARADRLTEPAGYAAALFALYGVETAPGADLPTAAVSSLADGGAAPAGFVLHADPLQLQPDRDCLLAFDLDDDPLDRDESAELEHAFNAHFADDGLRLARGAGGLLYLHCEPQPLIRTHPLATVIGRDVDRYLPDGEDRRRWRGLLNETQMLCHTLALNRAREAQGRPTLSGLWFSGGGRLPPTGRAPVARVSGDCPLARGLQALCSVDGDDELVVRHAAGKAVTRVDAEAWSQAVADLDGLLPQLARDVTELHVHPGNGLVLRWRPGMVWRWWRPVRPLTRQLEASAPTPDVSAGAR